MDFHPDAKIDTTVDIYGEYQAVLEELKTLERNAVYSEEKKPQLPENGIIQQVDGKWLFIGFLVKKQGEIKERKETGVGEFCFGEYQKQRPKVANSRGYKYLTQDYFDKMIEKLKEVLKIHKKTISKTKEKKYETPKSIT